MASVFKLCDSSGYTYSMKVYAGKEERCETDLATSVVLTLMDQYLDAGRTLVTDNFYTSTHLACKLLDRKTHLVGTVRSNRKGLPPSVTSAKLNKGETIAAQNTKGIVVQKWKDRTDVLTLSIKHLDSMIEVEGKSKKPEMVLFYNRTKQGIDISDQLASYHTCLRKTI